MYTTRTKMGFHTFCVYMQENFPIVYTNELGYMLDIYENEYYKYVREE